MLYRIKTVDGTKKKIPLAGSTPAGLPVGSILSTYKKIQPYNYLYCDGSTFDETQYPELYLYLGTNVLPDYRECVQVGAEKNTTDIFDSTETDPSTGLPGTQSHDVFTQGQFKDDQLQDHKHKYYTGSAGDGLGLGGSNYYFQDGRISNVYDARTGTTTRTKEKAVYYYIKAVDGVDIADEDTFLNTVVNTIQDAQSYSTTEEKTGGKWIDGKDIYRKVLNYSVVNLPSQGWTSVAQDTMNINKIVYICNFDQSGAVGEAIVGRINNGYIQMFSPYAWDSVGMIIEYTKNE